MYCICTIKRDNCFQKSSKHPALQRDHSLCLKFRITTFRVSRTSCKLQSCSCMKRTGFYSKSLPNSINPFLLEQPNVKIGMKKIMMMRRVSDIAIYCKTISTLWLLVWANECAGQSMWEKYPLNNQCYLQTRIIIVNVAYSWTTSVIQSTLMVVNEDSWFCGHTNSSIQVIITGIKSKAPKSTNKCDYLLAQSK